MRRPIDLLADGQRQAARARLLHRLGDSKAEAEARKGLRVLADALNYLEDEPGFDDAHYWLHETGRWVRTTFGCCLEQRDGQYWRTCPVDLSHIRYGWSPGVINVERLCSVCGQDPRLCRHATGRSYEAKVFRLEGKYCSACAAESCAHQVGELMSMRCWHLVTSFGADHIALVRRPRDPRARTTAVPHDTKVLQEHLGPNWAPGMHVSCDQCLTPCDGFSELDLGEH